MRLAVLAAAATLAAPAFASPDPADWPAVLAEARGQTVYWHAWGGSPEVNDYIAWVGREMAARHGVRVEHVKVADISETVSRVLAEKGAGRETGGAVDLMWINGENFAAMKRNDLLFGPWAEATPNWALVDVEGVPGVRFDFTVPTEGLESPWGKAQIVFFHDAARMPEPPRSMIALLATAEANPGRFAYPAPPDFTGTTFLKQALLELVEDAAPLFGPAEEADFAGTTAPLWAFLDALHPHLWRRGAAWPASGPQLRSMMADGEIDLAFSFNPNEAALAIATGLLPDTVRAYVFDGGSIGNVHFVAIPFNASAKAGAMATADFLLSPEAQARKADPAVWGDGPVIAVDALPPEDRALFDAIDFGVGALGPADLGPALPEPHPSWVRLLEAEWARRYGAGR
ncbi:MAG: ABC transporter substrate-binding protein [Rhodobacteraceae bacterium]|nr:MAG: ABC transporter substrate-binding protein [Paracoccaceae bacterium]